MNGLSVFQPPSSPRHSRFGPRPSRSIEPRARHEGGGEKGEEGEEGGEGGKEGREERQSEEDLDSFCDTKENTNMERADDGGELPEQQSPRQPHPGDRPQHRPPCHRRHLGRQLQNLPLHHGLLKLLGRSHHDGDCQHPWHPPRSLRVHPCLQTAFQPVHRARRLLLGCLHVADGGRGPRLPPQGQH